MSRIATETAPAREALTKDSVYSNHSSDYPQELRAGHATIRLLSITSLEVDDSPEDDREPFFQYGPYFVDDTRAIDPIKRVLEKSDWTEKQLNDAVKECDRDPEQEARDHRLDIAIDRALERED